MQYTTEDVFHFPAKIQQDFQPYLEYISAPAGTCE